MKTKLIIFSLIVAGICTMSCRQDEESLTEETLQSSLKEQNPEIESQRSSDSIFVENTETDPPRDGAHWKVEEITESVKGDSTSIPKLNLDSGPKDTPRDGAHWKEGMKN